MRKYSAFVIISVLFAAVASFDIQTTIVDGSRSFVSDLAEPFKKIGDDFYLIEASLKKTWYGAAHFCRTKGTHLASIETEEEWKALSSYLVSQGYTDKQWFWIAGDDFDEPHRFFWISTGQPMIFTKWSAGQPDNRGTERCVHLWRKGNEFLMNNWQCHMQAHYICKANTPKTVTITVW